MKTKRLYKVGKRTNVRFALPQSKVDESPYIRLSGHWLEDCGFKPGTKFQVVKWEHGILLNIVP